MGIVIDPESQKPLQCKECGGQNIASMLNESKIRCLDCGREKADPSSMKEIMRREMGSGANSWSPRKNPKPYREF